MIAALAMAGAVAAASPDAAPPAAAPPPTAAPPAAAGPIGLWRTPEDGGSTVRITDCGGAICGRLVTSRRLKDNPDQRDVLNKDPNLRTRQVRDLLVLTSKPIGPNRWGGGWAYDPTAGKTYTGSVELKNPGVLLLTGCVAVVFCRTETWERAE
ncbi:MAG TPA: DUF2147 domain-containing protein [Caulobacteraceae bacterium]|nr:DUF2147 domain-containing protein [Caulobacteraceae bacterium]